MHLDEFAVRVIDALLQQRRLRRTGADDGVRRSTKNSTDAAGTKNDRVGWKRLHFHGAQIHRANAAPDSRVVDYGGQKRPAFSLGHAAFRLMTANLLVERIKKLLPGGSPGERRAVIQRAAKTPVIEQSFRRAIERNSHAVEQIDDPGRRFAHALDQRLIREKVTAVNGVVKVLLSRVAFALLVLRGVNAALRAHGMRTFHWNDREKLHRHTRLGHTNRGHQPGETSAHDNNFRLSHLEVT